jgi:ABC-2 type transport system ATP-binding protein
MSLVVNELTKVYGAQYALNAISFTVNEGEIVAFLGPNGAGKSTTMKITTGFLAATSGTVLVNGMDVANRPMDVKRITGYLPEHNPLYPDMYVHEYLAFTGGLYGLSGKKLKTRVGEMVDMCGLSAEQNKKIEALSKGYRQRVGLAQALLHNPKVLILDEPTSGLDPNQLAEIRKLIKEVSKDKTVLFSTHIMQEVQAICDRVIVINKGTIVADARLAELVGKGESRMLIVEFEKPVALTEVEKLPGVMHARPMGETVIGIMPVPGADVRPAVFKFSAEQGNSLVGLRWDENSLENVFAELTRDNGH